MCLLENEIKVHYETISFLNLMDYIQSLNISEEWQNLCMSIHNAYI